MISNICYAIVFIIESIISIIYFNNKFNAKFKPFFYLPIIAVSSTLSFLVSLIGIPIINLVAFFIINFTILRLFYETNVKSSLFHTTLLVAFMVVTEIIVFYFSSAVLHIDLDACFNNQAVLITQATISKLLYFIIIYLSTKLAAKEKEADKSITTVFLGILPFSSIVFMHVSIYFCIIYNASNIMEFSLVFCNLFSLLSNIAVFYVHENTIKTNQKYTEILLEQQKEKAHFEYYELLKKQNQNSRVLIHDINKHLRTIKQLSKDNHNIEQYINEISDDFNMFNPVDYCNNAIVNIITHRYCEICKKNNIVFTLNIKEANLDFMKEHEITALLDNLLENAVEAASLSKERFIDFSICTRNSSFVIIKISNSCDAKPNFKNGLLVSSKGTTGIHGTGTKSIKRVVSNYNGNLNMRYDDSNHSFTVTIGIYFKHINNS